MAKKKSSQPNPIESIPLGTGIASILTVEIWENTADAGGSGSQSKRKTDDAFNLVINEIQRRYLEENVSRTTQTNTLKKLIGHRNVSTVAKEFVEPILKKNGVILGKTAIWNIANHVCKTFIALELAVKNNKDTLPPLELWSPESNVRTELLEVRFGGNIYPYSYFNDVTWCDME